VIEGAASVDESAITGESAPVIRAAGGDLSSVIGGTTILSDRIVVRIIARYGESFLDRMIALVEGAIRQAMPALPPTCSTRSSRAIRRIP
jgi:K+-transporting ATPase ATPase B chain